MADEPDDIVEYMDFLWDRGAKRLGYISYEDQQQKLNAAVRERRAAGKADGEAWAKAQLNADKEGT